MDAILKQIAEEHGLRKDELTRVVRYYTGTQTCQDYDNLSEVEQATVNATDKAIRKQETE